MKLVKHYLTGQQYLVTVTDLLQRIRLEAPYAGLYEAADLQWWWREENHAFPDHKTFWFDAQGKVVACLLRHDAGTEWNNDFLCLPSARQAVEDEILPAIVAEISHVDKTSTLSVRADDITLHRALAAAGFVQRAAAMIQTELTQVPAQTQLPPGFHVTSRVEDERPHHLMRRNGNDIALKLSECSLYRPELDLCVRDDAGSVAAYALFWMDDVTQVGLLEPLRTEAAYQRLGLARHLVAEGIARLREFGATSIRVTYSTSNEAAANLYHQLGFEDRIKALEFSRTPS